MVRDQKYGWLKLWSLKVNLSLSNILSNFLSDLGFGDENRKDCVCLISKWFCSTFLLQAILSRVLFQSFLQRLGEKNHCSFHQYNPWGFWVPGNQKRQNETRVCVCPCVRVRAMHIRAGTGNLRGRMFSHASKDTLRASSDHYGVMQSLSFSIYPSVIIKTMCWFTLEPAVLEAQ